MSAAGATEGALLQPLPQGAPMTTALPRFDEFKAAALARGFDEVLVREWSPSQVVGVHVHPFDADAIVVQGEMWLTCGDETRHLHPGDTFVLAHGTPHDERYGPQGAVYWVARRAAA